MKQYIDKTNVVAKIDDWRDKIIKGIATIPLKGRQRADAALEYEILGKIRDFLDTLEVKEMSNIWHTISDRDVDLPKAGDVICFIKNGKVISGEYRLNKFYGKVNNGYDNPIEKGDKWCFFLTSSDLLSK